MKIVGERILRIVHCLIVNQGVGWDDLKNGAAYSHPQATGQCREYLRTNGLRPEPASNTAAAVEMIKDKRIMNAAAIGSMEAAELHGMKVLAIGINDNPHNETRFIILGNEAPQRSGCDKTSLIVELKDEPGSINGVMMARGNINMSKIESRPIAERPWEYRFYIDLDAHADDPAMVLALEKMAAVTTRIKVLGSYSIAEERRPISIRK